MKARILCFGLAFTLLLSGCGSDSSTPHSAVTTHTTTYTTTSTADISVSATTDGYTSDTTTTSAASATTAESTSPITIHTTKTTELATTVTASANHSVATSTTVATSTDTVIFKATIRDNIHKKPVSGVTVTVYINGGAAPVGSAITDQSGVARISLHKGNSYRVVLSTLPTGYEADTEYRFATNTVNITIRKAAVQNELDHSEAQYDVGKTMTDFSLTDTDGKRYRLSDLLKEKKLVILNFWFTSCEPCKMEFPFFEAVTQKHSDDIALLAIDPFDSVASMVAIRNQLNVTFPMLQDTCKLYQGFDVTAYPTTVFIDSNGRILDIHIGSFPSEAAFLAAIEKHLY